MGHPSEEQAPDEGLNPVCAVDGLGNMGKFHHITAEPPLRDPTNGACGQGRKDSFVERSLAHRWCVG